MRKESLRKWRQKRRYFDRKKNKRRRKEKGISEIMERKFGFLLI